MRRKPGDLRPIEEDVLLAGDRLRARGIDEFYGFLLAKEMADAAGAKVLAAQGTLYRALNRLESAGLLESRWEDASEALAAHRPLRRLYTLTSLGDAALAKVAQRKPRPTADVRAEGAS